jgi:cob(I)alamin adenosyltransferase
LTADAIQQPVTLVGHRLSKIYTRTGDDGTTGLASGERIDKCDERVETFGDVDEVNSAIGIVLAEPQLPENVRACLTRLQHELFDLGAELAMPDYVRILAAHVVKLENDLDDFNAVLPPLKEFVLPGGNRAAAVCHLARAVCRRAERRAWAAAKITPLNPEALRYLNRLSDLLFVIARTLARRDNGQETLWRNETR